MSDFWPSGIELDDTQSPLEILHKAKDDWDANTNGALSLILQEIKTQSGNLETIVHAQHVESNRTATLLSVVHRSGASYPVTIYPKGENLPNYLKRSYYEEGFSGFAGLASGKREGKMVENSWVSETPSELRAKLSKAFNLGFVKSEILNLLSNPSVSNEEKDESDTDSQ